MSYIIELLLSWFLEFYENSEIPMSPEIYDRAVFTIGVGVPLLLYVCVLFSFVLVCKSVYDYIKGV